MKHPTEQLWFEMRLRRNYLNSTGWVWFSLKTILDALRFSP